MKICLVHNEYGKFSGEEVAVEPLSQLLIERSHEVIHFSRSSAEISRMSLGNIRAFFSCIHNLPSRKVMQRLLRKTPIRYCIRTKFLPIYLTFELGECRDAALPRISKHIPWPTNNRVRIGKVHDLWLEFVNVE